MCRLIMEARNNFFRWFYLHQTKSPKSSGLTGKKKNGILTLDADLNGITITVDGYNGSFYYFLVVLVSFHQ